MTMKSPITRRNVLKLMTAASGALLGSAILPEKWLKPVVETGVLPVHAQASASLSVANLTATQEFFFDERGHVFTATFFYTDALGEVDDSWTVHASWSAVGPMAFDGVVLASIGAVVSGDGFSGTINFSFSDNTCIFDQPDQTDIANISISKGARVSNVITDSVTEIEVGESIKQQSKYPAHNK